MAESGDDDLAQGSDEWRIVPDDPSDDEPLVQKNYGDSFEDTNLEDVLAESGSVDSSSRAPRPTRASARRSTGRSTRLRRHPRQRCPHHRRSHRVRRAAARSGDRPHQPVLAPVSISSRARPRDVVGDAARVDRPTSRRRRPRPDCVVPRDAARRRSAGRARGSTRRALVMRPRPRRQPTTRRHRAAGRAVRHPAACIGAAREWPSGWSAVVDLARAGPRAEQVEPRVSHGATAPLGSPCRQGRGLGRQPARSLHWPLPP